jgi:hypothetical protein
MSHELDILLYVSGVGFNGQIVTRGIFSENTLPALSNGYDTHGHQKMLGQHDKEVGYWKKYYKASFPQNFKTFAFEQEKFCLVWTSSE